MVFWRGDARCEDFNIDAESNYQYEHTGLRNIDEFKTLMDKFFVHEMYFKNTGVFEGSHFLY